MTSSKFRTARNGATLVEVLVVSAIIALLIGLLLPAMQRVRLAALRVDAANRMRQVVIATHHFAASNNNVIPSVTGERHNNYNSVHHSICEYLDVEYASVYKSEQGWNITYYKSIV